MKRKEIIVFVLTLLVCFSITIPCYAADYHKGLTNLIEIGKLAALLATIIGIIHEMITKRNFLVMIGCILVAALLVYSVDLDNMKTGGKEIINVIKGGSIGSDSKSNGNQGNQSGDSSSNNSSSGNDDPVNNSENNQSNNTPGQSNTTNKTTTQP